MTLIAKLKHWKPSKLQKKFEGLILSGQYRTLFGAWMWN